MFVGLQSIFKDSLKYRSEEKIAILDVYRKIVNLKRKIFVEFCRK